MTFETFEVPSSLHQPLFRSAREFAEATDREAVLEIMDAPEGEADISFLRVRFVEAMTFASKMIGHKTYDDAGMESEWAYQMDRQRKIFDEKDRAKKTKSSNVDDDY